MSRALSITYGIGGYDADLPNDNLLEVVELTDDGQVVTRDGSGTVLEQRPATPAELAPAQSAPADDTAALRQQVSELRAQLDALTEALGG